MLPAGVDPHRWSLPWITPVVLKSPPDYLQGGVPVDVDRNPIHREDKTGIGAIAWVQVESRLALIEQLCNDFSGMAGRQIHLDMQRQPVSSFQIMDDDPRLRARYGSVLRALFSYDPSASGLKTIRSPGRDPKAHCEASQSLQRRSHHPGRCHGILEGERQRPLRTCRRRRPYRRGLYERSTGGRDPS